MKEKKQSGNFIGILLATGILICITLLLLFFYFSYINTLSKDQNEKIYDKYYLMIADDADSSFWESVYESAKLAADEQNAYVELLSNTLSYNYTTEELMEIAIASKADGIILSADESERMSELINEAYANDIPVVTVFSDNTTSERISFVGVGNYNLGSEYGNLIGRVCTGRISERGKIEATVLMDSTSTNSGQNVLYAAIQETVEKENEKHSSSHSPIEVTMRTIDGSSAFSVEESIRKLFIVDDSKIPDIIVCLNEIDTTSVYQAVVDYNEVGKVTILGYHDAEAILKGIERKVIYATVTIDTKQLGQFCVDALSEYYELGNTSQYFTADIAVIDQNNVSQYIEGDDDEKQNP